MQSESAVFTISSPAQTHKPKFLFNPHPHPTPLTLNQSTQGATKSMIIDHAYLLEGHFAHELPEALV